MDYERARSPSPDALAMTQRNSITLVVQVCGRRELLAVPAVTVPHIAAAVEKRFEVRPPFIFADPQGRVLADEGAVTNCVAKGEPLLVRFTDGALLDLGKRVDQIRHLQWGLLADKLAAPAVPLPEATKNDNGGSLSSRAGAEVQQNLQALHDLVLRERSARDLALREVDGRFAEERRYREQVEASFRKQLVDAEHRLRKEVTAAQATVEAAAAGWRGEAAELRQATAEMAQALAHEEAKRRAGHDGLVATFNQEQARRGNELATPHQLEALRREVESESQERRNLDATLSRLAAELRHRCDEEAVKRREEMDGLRHRMAEEGDKWIDSSRKLTSLTASMQELRGLSPSRSSQQRASIPVPVEVKEGTLPVEPSAIKAELVEFCQQLVGRLRDDCREAMQREVRSRLEREKAVREEIAELRTSLAARAASAAGGGSPSPTQSGRRRKSVSPRRPDVQLDSIGAQRPQESTVLPAFPDSPLAPPSLTLGLLQHRGGVAGRPERAPTDGSHSSAGVSKAMGPTLGLGVPGFGSLAADSDGDGGTARSASTTREFHSHRMASVPATKA